MRVSCSLILLAVFLVLQSEGTPIIISTTTSDATDVHTTLNPTPIVGTLTSPLVPNHLLNANLVKSGLVGNLGHHLTPIAGHATAPLNGLRLGSLSHAAEESILTKRDVKGFASPFGGMGMGNKGLPGMNFLSGFSGIMPKVASIPGVSPAQGAAYTVGGTYLRGLDGFTGMLGKREFSDSFFPMDTFSTFASGLPSVNPLPSVPFMGAMPSLDFIPGFGAIPGADVLSGLTTSGMRKRGLFGKKLPLFGTFPGLLSGPLSTLNSHHASGSSSPPNLPLLGSVSTLAPVSSISSLQSLPVVGTLSGGQGSLPGVDSLTGALPDLGSTLPGGIPDLGSTLPGGIPDLGSTLPGGIPDLGSTLPGGIPDLGSTLPGGIPDIGSTLPLGLLGGDSSDS